MASDVLGWGDVVLRRAIGSYGADHVSMAMPQRRARGRKPTWHSPSRYETSPARGKSRWSPRSRWSRRFGTNIVGGRVVGHQLATVSLVGVPRDATLRTAVVQHRAQAQSLSVGFLLQVAEVDVLASSVPIKRSSQRSAQQSQAFAGPSDALASSVRPGARVPKSIAASGHSSGVIEPFRPRIALSSAVATGAGTWSSVVTRCRWPPASSRCARRSSRPFVFRRVLLRS